jgi:hypothetical protein
MKEAERKTFGGDGADSTRLTLIETRLPQYAVQDDAVLDCQECKLANSVSLKEMASSMRKFEGGDKRSAVQARLYRIFEYLAIVL